MEGTVVAYRSRPLVPLGTLVDIQCSGGGQVSFHVFGFPWPIGSRLNVTITAEPQS